MPNKTSKGRPKTLKPKGLKKLTKKQLILDGQLDQVKADWLWHHAIRKVVIGGKGTGKTHPVKMKEAWLLETYPDANTFDFRKYKDAATSTLSAAMLMATKHMRWDGYDIEEYKRSMNNLYRIKDKRIMDNNQKQRFGSLDDPTSTDGQAPSNGGYYGIVHIDEPVVKDDVLNPDKIPNKEQFDISMEVIRDNLERFNTPYMVAKGLTKPPQYEEFFTMNPWGNHPLIVEAQEFFPEEQFFQFVTGYDIDTLMDNPELVDELFANQDWINQVQTNHTLAKHNKENDTLYVRMSKWANPMNRVGDKSQKIFEKLKEAFLSGEHSQVMLILGMKYEEDIETRMMVFHVDDYRKKSDQDLMDGGWKVDAVNYSIDVDTSRVFTITPTYVLRKENIKLHTSEDSVEAKAEYSYKVFVDKQIELKAKGTGSIGELNDVYVNMLEEIIKEHHINRGLLNVETVIISVDDKRKWYLHELSKKNIFFVTNYRTFEQHGIWSIANRQDMVTNGLENDSLWIHEDNVMLIEDMKTTIKADINKPERKTSGKTNYLDRIDSMENGIVPFADIIWDKETIGG